MNYTKGEIKTLGDVWEIFKKHGLEGKYCPICDQFAQARILQKQDELISDMYEACLAAKRYDRSICGKAIRGEVDLLANGAGITEDIDLDDLYSDWQIKVNKALAKAEGKQ